MGYGVVLRQREFAAMFVSDGLSTVGDQVARIAVALLVLERTGSSLAAAATYACSYLTWLVAGPLLSGLPDRYPRRRVIVVSDLLRMVLVLVLTLPGLPLWGVFAVLILVGLLAPPVDAARSALLADMLSGEQYVVGNALNNSVSQVGHVLGFVAGGALVAGIGVRGALLADALSFAVSVVLLSVLVVERGPGGPATAPGSRWLEALAGFQLVWGQPRLRMLLTWALVSAAAVVAAEGLAVPIADDLGGGPVAAGLLTAAVPAGFLIGSYGLLRVPPGRRERLFPGLVTLSCLPLLLTPLTDDLAVLTGLWVVAGCGNALQLVANSAFVQEVAPGVRGRAFGVAVTVLMATQGGVLLAAGALAEVVGPRASIAVWAGVALLLVPVVAALHSPSAQGAAMTGRSGQR